MTETSMNFTLSLTRRQRLRCSEVFQNNLQNIQLRYVIKISEVWGKSGEPSVDVVGHPPAKLIIINVPPLPGLAFMVYTHDLF
jgi:hypothetical protein